MTDAIAPENAGNPTGKPPPVSTATRFFYGFGSIAYGIKDIAFRTYLLWYYNYVVGVSPALVGTAILAVMIVDAFSDPIVGQISDNLRTKWGRRHPLMYASAIPAALSFLALWMPPEGLSNTGMFFYIVIVGSMVRTFITLYEIPSSALAPELSTDYNERTSIASYRYFFGYLGGIGMSFLALKYFLTPTEEYPIGQLNPQGYLSFAYLGASLMFLSVMISTAGTHHRIKWLRIPEDKTGKRSVFQVFGEMFQTFSHKGFLAILSFGVLKYTAIGMTSALTLYFATYFWELPAEMIAYLSLEALVAAVLALAIAPWVSKKLGKRNAAFALAVVAVTFAGLSYMLRWVGLFPANGTFWLLPCLFALQTVYYLAGVCSAILIHAMIGDVIDESTLRTGRRSEGLFYAANSLMQKSVSGLGVMMAGILLTLVKMPDRPQPGEVPHEVINNLALVYIPTIFVLYVGGACFLFFYRLDRKTHEENLERLKEIEGEEPKHRPDVSQATVEVQR